jgi:hypothetical protein
MSLLGIHVENDIRLAQAAPLPTGALAAGTLLDRRTAVFRPTQIAPTVLTAFNIAAGFFLAILLVVLALLNTADTRVLAVIGAESSQDSGLLFLTAAGVFGAIVRPLAGGLLLLVLGILTLWPLPLIGVIAVVFALLSLLRALLSRRYLAAEAPGGGGVTGPGD